LIPLLNCLKLNIARGSIAIKIKGAKNRNPLQLKSKVQKLKFYYNQRRKENQIARKLLL